MKLQKAATVAMKTKICVTGTAFCRLYDYHYSISVPLFQRSAIVYILQSGNKAVKGKKNIIWKPFSFEIRNKWPENWWCPSTCFYIALNCTSDFSSDKHTGVCNQTFIYNKTRKNLTQMFIFTLKEVHCKELLCHYLQWGYFSLTIMSKFQNNVREYTFSHSPPGSWQFIYTNRIHFFKGIFIRKFPILIFWWVVHGNPIRLFTWAHGGRFLWLSR